MKIFLVKFTIFFLWPRALPNPNLKCTHLSFYNKIMKMRASYFFDIATMTFKFSGNVLFINLESHEKYCERVSTGKDATPRV